jgi:4-amino-4-deoxy-L-arabinose transferase-like glycosyltransferase
MVLSKKTTLFFSLTLALALFISFLQLGGALLFDVDEAIFSQASKEMLLSGDFITPTFNGNVRYDKPVLIYWLMSFSYRLFGVNEFAARLPSALAGVALAVSIFIFMNKFRGRDKALLASLSFIVSIYFAAYSHAAVTDMALVLFISLSLFCFYFWSENGGNLLYGFYIFSALALLTKGLIGVLFPFGTALIYAFISGGLKRAKQVFTFKGIFVFLLIALPWHLAMYSLHGQEFIDKYIIKHHFQRYTAVNSGHRGPFFYYLLALLAGLFPWAFFLPQGISKALAERKSPAFFALVWFLLVFVFFSISKTKLPNYIFPLVPAACIVIAEGAGTEKWSRFSNAGIFILSIAAGAGLLYFLTTSFASILGTAWLIFGAALLFGLAMISIYSIFIFKKRDFLYPRAGIMAALIVLVLMRGFPAAGSLLQGELHSLSTQAARLVPPGGKVLCFGISNPSILLYSDRGAVFVHSTEELAQVPGRDLFLIARTKDAEKLHPLGFKVIERGAKYALLEKP